MSRCINYTYIAKNRMYMLCVIFNAEIVYTRSCLLIGSCDMYVYII